MRKLILLSFLIITLGANAQFKFGATAGIGAASKSTVAPVDSFQTATSIGLLGELGLKHFFLRTGYVFNNPNSATIPVELMIRTSETGGFIGGGLAFPTDDNAKDMYEIILGNRLSRSLDFSICFMHPIEGTIHESILTFRLAYFPLSTCIGKCY